MKHNHTSVDELLKQFMLNDESGAAFMEQTAMQAEEFSSATINPAAEQQFLNRLKNTAGEAPSGPAKPGPAKWIWWTTGCFIFIIIPAIIYLTFAPDSATDKDNYFIQPVKQEVASDQPAAATEAEAGSQADPAPAKNPGAALSPEPGPPLADTEQWLRSMSPKPQVFTIDPTIDQEIRGKQGTLVSIPMYSFRDGRGNVVTAPLEFRLTELYRKSEILLAGLPTVSGGHPLESGGVVRIEAFSGDEELKLSDAGIDLSFPAEKFQPDMKWFTAAFSESGNFTGWQVGGELKNLLQQQAGSNGGPQWDGAGNENDAGIYALHFEKQAPKQLLALPLKHFQYLQYRDGKFMEFNRVNKMIGKLISPGYEKTFVSTMEFDKRLRAMMSFGEPERILEIYLNNLNMPLWQVDSMVAEKFEAERDEYAARQYQAKLVFEADDKLRNYQQIIDLFRYFSAEQFGTVDMETDLSGINLNKADAQRRLIEAGIAEADAEAMVNAWQMREVMILKMKNKVGSEFYIQDKGKAIFIPADSMGVPILAPTDQVNVLNAKAEAQYLFRINQLGWINCDRFKEKADVPPVIVQLSGQHPSNTMNYLVFRKEKVVLPGGMTADGQAAFHGVPDGKEVAVVSIAYDGKQPLMGIREFRTGEAAQVEVKAVSTEKMLDELKKLDKK